MATNSPRATSRLMPARISLRSRLEPKPLPTFLSSSKAMPILSGRLQAALDDAHQAIEHEPDQTDGEDAEDDVFVDQAVVLLPQEAAHARAAGQHLDRHDDQPGNAEAQPV